MLVGYRGHLRPGGHLFLVLPRLCLTNSTRMTRASFVEMLERTGFRIRKTRESPKVAFFCATATQREPTATPDRPPAAGTARPDAGAPGNQSSKRAKRGDRGKNDFAITMRSTLPRSPPFPSS